MTLMVSKKKKFDDFNNCEKYYIKLMHILNITLK